MKSSFFCITLVFILGFTCNAQHNKRIDSLLKVYQSQPEDTLKLKTIKLLFDSYLNNDLKEAKKYAVEELGLSKKLDYKKGEGLAYLHLGVLHEYRSQLDSAKVDYNKARNIFQQIKHSGLEVVSIRNTAGIEYNLGNYDEALEILDEGIAIHKKSGGDSIALIPFYHNKGLNHYFKGNHRIATQLVLKELKLLENLDNPIAKADALNLLANTETSQGNYQKSISYNEEALKIYREFNDQFFEINVLNDIGLNYYTLEDYAKAIQYLEKALEVNRNIKNQSLQSTILTNLGNSYANFNRTDKAIETIKNGIEVAEKIGAKNKTVEGYNALANVYNVSNQLDPAIFYYSKSIALIDSDESKNNLSNAYEGRSNLYAKIGNYRLAYEDYLSHKKLSDSIYNTVKSQQIEELKTIYETEKKEQQIAIQDQEINLLEEKAKVSNLQKLLLGGGLGLSLLVVGFGFYGFRQKIKRNKIEKEKVDAELAFKKKELTTHALHLAKKNEVLESVKLKAKALKEKEDVSGYKELIKTINFDQQDDKNWESFTQYFEQVHKDFASTVKTKYPDVTKNELRFMALLKMNLSSKEIATILNISTDGIKKARQRLRKKMGLTPQDSLENTVLSI